MSTYCLTFITKTGGVAVPQHVGDLRFARGLINLWATSVESEDGALPSPDHDRVCVLIVPSPSERKRTAFRGNAYVFNLEEAQRWASR